MNKKILFILVLVFSLTSVSAKTIEVDLIIQGLEPIQEVEYYYDYPVYHTIFSDYAIDIAKINVWNYDKLTEYNNESFKAQLISKNNEVLHETGFEPSFIILSDPPTETDLTTTTLNFPYSEQAKYLKVYYEGVEKLSVDITERLCNNNGRCDGSENYYSCPADCKINAKDGICVNAAEELGFKGKNNETLRYWEDGFCDKDCYKDDDCELVEEGYPEYPYPSPPTGWAVLKSKKNLITGLILIAIVILTVYLVWKKKK